MYGFFVFVVDIGFFGDDVVFYIGLFGVYFDVYCFGIGWCIVFIGCGDFEFVDFVVFECDLVWCGVIDFWCSFVFVVGVM